MKLSECKSLEDIKRFKEGTGSMGRVWIVDKNGFVVTLLQTEYRIILDYSCDSFIWRDEKQNNRYEDLFNNRQEAEKTAYLKRVRLAQEMSDKAKEHLDWLLANPPEDD